LSKKGLSNETQRLNHGIKIMRVKVSVKLTTKR